VGLDEDPVNPNDDAYALLFKVPDWSQIRETRHGYWDCDIDTDIDYFREDPHDASLTAKGYRALCVPVLDFVNLYPLEITLALTNDFTTAYALVALDARVVPSLQWGMNHYFAGTLVYLLRKTLASCPAFAVGPALCNHLRQMGFKEVFGDEATCVEDLVPLLTHIQAERGLNRSVVLGDAEVERHPFLAVVDELGLSPDAIPMYRDRSGVPEYFTGYLRTMKTFTPNEWVVLFGAKAVSAYGALLEEAPEFRRLKKLCIGEDVQAALEARTGEEASAVCHDEDPASLAAVMMMYDSIHG
jgi:uroporphyrinogen-III synthase